MTTLGTGARGQEDTERIIDLVHQLFAVDGEYLRDDSAIEFSLSPLQNDTKTGFLSLIDALRKTSDTAALRRKDGGYLLLVYRKPVYPRQRTRTPLILFVATIIAVLADGFLRAYSYQNPNQSHLALYQEITVSVIYAVALMGILGIHELGHKVASWYHKMESSWPYFIPGIPGIWPTFGAVISTRDPPTNRDSLFDLGLSGPIAGLVVTFIVSIIAVASSSVVSASSYGAGATFTGSDYFTSFLVGLLKSPSPSSVVTGPLFTLLYFAYSIGFLITFINLLPAWQLDGGHISNAAVSPKVHKILTYVSILIMIVIGFYLMAFLILIFASRAPGLEPLDNVSPLSRKRRVFFELNWVLALA